MWLPGVRVVVDRAQTLLGRINIVQLGTDPSTAGGVSVLLGVRKFPIGIYMNRKMCHDDGERN